MGRAFSGDQRSAGFVNSLNVVAVECVPEAKQRHPVLPIKFNREHAARPSSKFAT
jgi:hypothetical protein